MALCADRAIFVRRFDIMELIPRDIRLNILLTHRLEVSANSLRTSKSLAVLPLTSATASLRISRSLLRCVRISVSHSYVLQLEEKYATSATDLNVNAVAKSASGDVATPTDGISFGGGSQSRVQGIVPNRTDSVALSAAAVEKDYQECSHLPRRLNQDSNTALSNAGTQYSATADAAKIIRSLPAPQRELDPTASDNTTPPPLPSTLGHEPVQTSEVTLPTQPPRDHDAASIAQREDTESSPGGRRVLIIGPSCPLRIMRERGFPETKHPQPYPPLVSTI